MWPQTLAEWNLRRIELDTIPQSIDATHPEPGAAIVFALKHRDARALLPAAFYQLAITREEIDWLPERLARVTVPVVPPLAARWTLLDAATMRRFTRGRSALLAHYFAHIKAKFQSSRLGRPALHGAAVEWCKCDYAQLRIWVNLARRGKGYDCLRGLGELIEWPENLPGLCEGCSEKNRAHFRGLQQEVWNKLPEFFELGWKRAEAALGGHDFFISFIPYPFLVSLAVCIK
ncbi:hypothetical protein PsYK624_076790 [Phanerochaete sordida]|uniref:Uncharacterized protein n=1 Tax=Phanerochaete sordida TaxID=48140 RepID=A0A9P3GBW7_9APHY|nr:hypothetical protein PsYK624_076790 [Phanerochaete sordida]